MMGAYSMTDGSRKWGVECPRTFCAAPSDDLIVFVGNEVNPEGELVALDRATGKTKWKASAGALEIIGADSESVYFTSSRNRSSGYFDRLHAFDVASRTMRWSVPFRTEDVSVDGLGAAVGSGRLVVFAVGGKVTAFDTRTGKVAWDLPEQTKAVDSMLPAISEGIVYFGGKTLTARELKSGKEVWSLPAKSEVTKLSGGWGPPAIDGDALYAVDGDVLSRRDKRDGKTDWTFSLGVSGSLLGPPAVQGDTVWAGQMKNHSTGVVAVHKDTGEQAWRYARGDGGLLTMVGTGNRVILVQDGTVTAMPVF